MKLTPQRRLVMDIIHDSRGHLTAEEILDYVQARAPGVNKSTIYRTLELLEELGCVFKSESGGRFIYHHAEEGHHHHLVCQVCGKSIDCDEDLFLPVEKVTNEKYGFRADFRHVVISGLCQSCKKLTG
ncbi:Fur family transcriptional regulator, partial [Chloroflexota bacterium]